MKTEKITLAQFKKDVITELKLIKENATAEEKDKLILSQFSPNYGVRCIYGLMAGYCRSERAMKLINLCCQRFVKNDVEIVRNNMKFSELQKYVNGNTVGEIELRKLHYFSSLEIFILIPKNEKHFKKIFAFLKDETETIKL
jgi:hypothetical protein